MVEFTEYQIPNFKIAFVFSARIHFFSRCYGIVCLTPVVKYITVWPALSFTDIPEVTLDSNNELFIESDNIFPYIYRVIIFRMNSDIEHVLIKTYPLIIR